MSLNHPDCSSHLVSASVSEFLSRRYFGGVRAHIAICYMAFCCLQHLRKRLKMLGHPMSPARIRKELNAVQLSILRRKGTGERHAMPCHARHHRRKTHSDMRWPDLERGSLSDAAGTDAQNRPDQRLKQTTV